MAVPPTPSSPLPSPLFIGHTFPWFFLGRREGEAVCAEGGRGISQKCFLPFISLREGEEEEVVGRLRKKADSV